ncbi:hypothetical protein Halha_1680 [Halobacteroides halobius DSM 5150]|uniref:Uncharacterized protein n=1 Tax=Halobacteroides halobius (strain ATCC 35273 / DSM 5150 / MD-1) TaxID=748449 RepID=L0K8K2_HALHC|nr:L,D-transpeptidase family protein [Halobacteroides halobius]AGB41617.1 hypothetical protein Halha_1680 [Halobacteroides halobius DSM 5150]
MSKILIILNQRRLYLYQGRQVDRSFPVAIGKDSTPTPTGNFSILNKIKNPYNPALGSRWMQFTRRMHGIHGTNQPWLIGQAVSHGCVRMYNQDAEYIYDRVEVGTPVEIIKSQSNTTRDFFYYTVEPGDTLYKIANSFNTTVNVIVDLNKIENKNLIYPGQKLKIPQ